MRLGYTSILVTVGGTSAAEIAYWRDRSIIEGKKDHVLKALRIIVPEILDVDLISSRGCAATGLESKLPSPVYGVPVVRLKNADNYIPLRSLGNGVEPYVCQHPGSGKR